MASKRVKPVNRIIHMDQYLAGRKGKKGEPERGGAQTSEAVLVTPAVSGAGGAVSLTLAAVAGRRNVVKSLVFGYDTVPTGGRLTITDAGANVFDIAVPAAGPMQIPFPDGIQTLLQNSALVVTLAAGGGAVVAKINASATLL